MAERDKLVGERIKAARQAAGLTQWQLAEAVGVSRSAVAQWETGRTGQVGINLSRIGAIVGVPAGELLEGTKSDASAADVAEQALLRLYRTCSEENRAILMREAVKLARRPGSRSG